MDCWEVNSGEVGSSLWVWRTMLVSAGRSGGGVDAMGSTFGTVWWSLLARKIVVMVFISSEGDFVEKSFFDFALGPIPPEKNKNNYQPQLFHNFQIQYTKTS